MTETPFSGFPEDTLRFLAELAENNDRVWFQKHKKRYEQALLEPAKAFVAALGERFAAFAPDVQAEPRVNGSIFRINRDTRFSSDKTPYKTHLDLWFWSGLGRTWDNPGFFFRLAPDQLILGAGMHKLEPKRLREFRDAVADDARGTALVAALNAVRAAGPYVLGGEHYKRVPSGFAADHPRADLLRHNGLFATFEQPPPPLVREPGFVDFCEQHFRAMLPLHVWLGEHLP